MSPEAGRDPEKLAEELKAVTAELDAERAARATLSARVAELEHRIVQYHLNEEAHRLVARMSEALIRFPRIAGVARTMVRWVGRLTRPAAPTPAPGDGARALTLVPLAGLRPVDPANGAWEATDNDPQFLTEELLEYSGWILVRLRMQTGFSVQQPVIHFDYGGGWMAQGAIMCERPSPADGESETVGLIPANVQRARFDPTGHPGLFKLERFEVLALDAAEAERRMREALAARGRDAPAGLDELAQAYGAALAHVDMSYAAWIRQYEFPPERYAELAKAQATWRARPTVSLIAPGGALPGPLVESLKAQVYPHWELWIAGDVPGPADPRIRRFEAPAATLAAAANAALAAASGELFAVLDGPAVLHPLALHYVAQEALGHPEAGLVYTDEDSLGEDGARCDPWFKCEPNLELLLAHDMVGRLACYRTGVLREAGGMREGFEGAEAYDTVLRVMDRIGAARVRHVPRVLAHARKSEPPETRAESSRRAVAEHLARTGVAGEVMPAPGGQPGMQRVRFPLPDPAPTVTIVIPTRDRPDLLRTCIASIIGRTEYQGWRILVMDNGSKEQETLDLFEHYRGLGVEIIRDESEFNYSALNNRAVAAATTDFVCLMNNDIEVLASHWLEEMVSMAARPGVGAVGARLWYPDFRLQHAGLVIGIAGLAGYPHKLLPQGEPGYACRAILHQSFSAVTAACLVVRRSIYEEVGGLDEQLPVAFNDLDFCLRLLEAGYRNVWTPYAELVHHESASRGSDFAPDKVLRLAKDIAFIRRRWGDRLFSDPAYSPNLTLDAEDFALAWPPRV